MRHRSALSCVIVGVGIAGCSIHPLPEDFARDATREIVHKIRCETQEALFHRIKSLFKEAYDDPKKARSLLYQSTRDAYDLIASYNRSSDYHDGLKKLRSLTTSDIDPITSARIERFRNSGIKYEFQLTITENNNNSINSTFTLPMTNNTFTLGIGGGLNKARKNIRSVDVTDTFRSLIYHVECDKSPGSPVAENFLYPITGRIGMQEVVDTYIDTFKEVSSLNDDIEINPILASNVSGSLETFSDVLTFTTKVTNSIKPKVTINAIKDSFKLTELSGDLTSDRTDEHQVTLTISTVTSKTTYDFVSIGKGVQIRYPKVVVRQGRIPAPFSPQKDRTKRGVKANQLFYVSPDRSREIKQKLDQDSDRNRLRLRLDQIERQLR